MAAEQVEVPLIIGGEEVRTGNTREMVMPHDHGHVLGMFHQAGEKEVARAADAATEARAAWGSLPWAERRAVFRKAGERYYSFVDMAFTGIDYCGTMPAPKEGKTKAIEYYIQAIDDGYEPTRTSTFLLQVEPEEICEFAPVEQDETRASSIRVFATSRKQGKKLDGGFLRTGVTFVPSRK